MGMFLSVSLLASYPARLFRGGGGGRKVHVHYIYTVRMLLLFPYNTWELDIRLCNNYVLYYTLCYLWSWTYKLLINAHGDFNLWSIFTGKLWKTLYMNKQCIPGLFSPFSWKVMGRRLNSNSLYTCMYSNTYIRLSKEGVRFVRLMW